MDHGDAIGRTQRDESCLAVLGQAQADRLNEIRGMPGMVKWISWTICSLRDVDDGDPPPISEVTHSRR